MRSAAHRAMVLAVLAVMLLTTTITQSSVPTAAEGPGSSDHILTPPSSPTFVPDELLVRFHRGVPPQRIAQLLAGQGVTPLRHIRGIDVHVLRLPSRLPAEQAAESFRRMPEVAFAEPNAILHILQIDDPGLANQWAPQRIQAPEAWQVTAGDPSVVIAVVDTGVDYRHGQLSPNIWQNDDPPNGSDDDHNGYPDDTLGWDFANNDSDPIDDHDHGTHVAGIAAAALDDNPAGVVGICPRCRIMPVKVMRGDGTGTLDAVASGIVYAADNGAKVVNLSLGSAFPSSTLEEAVNYAWGRGCSLSPQPATTG
ncbi:MAG TPA: S8 family serine peptidase [Chloroflexota bacterium]